MVSVNDDFERVLGLVAELSIQLSANRAHCAALKRQAEDLKIQAVHTGTGFTLRRFNVDITKEQFESELERLNATLVVENHSLQHENRHLSMLLKDHENTLEVVMERFRSYAHATQQHDLEVARHYENLLLELSNKPPEGAEEVSSSSDSTEPTARVPLQDLDRISSLLRKALRSLQGEDPDPPPSDAGQQAEGGYLSVLGVETFDEDSALQKDIEIETLRQENAHLREVLDLATQAQVTAVEAGISRPPDSAER